MSLPSGWLGIKYKIQYQEATNNSIYTIGKPNRFMLSTNSWEIYIMFRINKIQSARLFVKEKVKLFAL